MKNRYLFFAASLIAVVFSALSCSSKEETVVEPEVKPIVFTFFASLPEDVKISITEETEGDNAYKLAKLAWEVGDQITVIGTNTVTASIAAAEDISEDGKRAKFSAAETPAGDSFTLLYHPTNPENAEALASVCYDGQVQEGNGSTDHLGQDKGFGFGMTMTGVTDLSDVDFSTAVAQNSIMQLILKLPEAVAEVYSIYVTAALSGSGTFAQTLWFNDGEKVFATPTDGQHLIKGYMMIPALSLTGNLSVRVETEDGAYEASYPLTNGTWTAGSQYTVKKNMSSVSPATGDHANMEIHAACATDILQFKKGANADKPKFKAANVIVEKDINMTSAGTWDTAISNFSGTIDGGDHTIDYLAATQPLIANLGSSGTVKNITLGSHSSVTYSSSVTSELHLGAFVGNSQGNLTDCSNYAPVSCTSTSFSAPLNIGGLVGTQYKTGTISGSTNYASVSCSASGPSTLPSDTDSDAYVNPIYMGGVLGSLRRLVAGDNAEVNDTGNEGSVNGNFTVLVMSHVAGVIGWVNTISSTSKLKLTGLSNTGNVTLVNRAGRNDYSSALVAGLIGGIHGSQISNGSGEVEVKNSYVSDCTISNGGFSNSLGYGQACHTAGFVGVARGGTITFSDNCYVQNVDVKCRRGLAGGFASWVYGTTFDACKVLDSSVQGTLAQCRLGGGLVGHMRNGSEAKDCIVTLIKDGTHSLYGNGGGNSVVLGGIVGSSQGSCTIDGCKVFVRKMSAINYGTSTQYGWILGQLVSGEGNSITIKDCGIGGTYDDGATAINLTSSNFSDYICNDGAPTYDEEHPNVFWDGDSEVGITDVTINIGTYGASQGWTKGNSYSEITQDGVTLTESHSGSNPNGLYSKDTPTDWRFYLARGGGITVSVPEGHFLISATYTYLNANDGIIIAPDGTTQIPSEETYSLSEPSAFFSVARNGSGSGSVQVKITDIIIKYK